MSKLNVVVLVSDDISDIYFANQLIKQVNVTGIIVESKNFIGSKEKTKKYIELISKRPNDFIIKALKKIKNIKNDFYIKYYDKKALKIAKKGFGMNEIKIDNTKKCNVYYTNSINLNSPDTVNIIKNLSPDLIAVCGTSILKKPIIELPKKGVLNLHGGLSQKYRGVWTTLWAIYNNEPEYVGATVHYVDEGIDSGNIIYQGRPVITEEDNHESLYVKVVKVGTHLMIKAIKDIERGKVNSFKPKVLGKIYYKKMVTPMIIKETWGKINKGVIKNYLKFKDIKEKKVEKEIGYHVPVINCS